MPFAVFVSHFFQGYVTSLFPLKLEKDDYKHVFSCDIKLKLWKTDHTKLLLFAFWRRSLSLKRWTLYILLTFSNIIMTDIMASTIICSTAVQTAHITSLITLQKLEMGVHYFLSLLLGHCWSIQFQQLQRCAVLGQCQRSSLGSCTVLILGLYSSQCCYTGNTGLKSSIHILMPVKNYRQAQSF